MTCLAVSEVHSLIVSGSRDLTCILWDMEELSYITQLAGHTTSISALAINELTVSPSSCPPFSTCCPLKISLCPLFLLFFAISGSLLPCCSSSVSSQHEEERILTVDNVHILFACVLLFCSLSLCAHGRQHHIILSKGEIASCAGPLLYLWTMKGQLLACTDTSCGPRPDVLCVSFTQRHEWDARNVVVTGCADGIVRVSVFLYACNNVIVTVCV